MKRPLLVVLLLALLLSGCWNRRDPELLAFVIATGFDWEEETGLYKIIVQIANPLVIGGQEDGGQGNPAPPFWVLEARGHTPFEARQNLTLLTSRELFWAHNEILVLGEDLARKGISPVLDHFQRERQLRLIAYPMVVQGDIRSLFEAKFPLEETGAEGLRRQVVATMFDRAMFPVKETRELIITLGKPGFDLLIGRVEELGAETGDQETGTPPPAKLSGGAVFQEDRMVGWLQERAVAGWHWVRNRAFRATQIVMSPTDQEPVAVEISNSSTTLTPQVEGDRVSIHVTVEVEGRIQDQLSPTELAPKRERLEALERRLATVVKNDILLAVNAARNLKSDFLGFGNLVYRKLPKDWERLEDRWQEIFPSIEVYVDVEVDIIRSGLVKEPPLVR